jgi:hypothetical protein
MLCRSLVRGKVLVRAQQPILSDNQVTVACATLGKLRQISLLPLTKNIITKSSSDQCNQPSESQLMI